MPRATAVRETILIFIYFFRMTNYGNASVRTMHRLRHLIFNKLCKNKRMSTSITHHQSQNHQEDLHVSA